jgi:hypothetical protein
MINFVNLIIALVTASALACGCAGAEAATRTEGHIQAGGVAAASGALMAVTSRHAFADLRGD